MLLIKRFFSLVAIIFFAFTVNVWASADGERIFNTTCMVCHTIGGGAMVGPDLKDVHKRRNTDWIKKFIKSSQSMVRSGDEQAVKLFNEYNKMPMPDQNLTDLELMGLIEYITEQSSPSDATDGSTPKKIKLPALQTEEISLGQALFTGQKRFEKDGPSCISCHSVNVSEIISGGSLAVNLTNVYSRMSDAGVAAIISAPPFPAMACAYENKKLDEDEVFALKAFLRSANEKSTQSSSYSGKLFGIGVVGAIAFLILFSLIWKNRRRDSVNQKIFDRQIKSE